LIPLELVLAILDALRAETIDGLASPGNPTEFGFGTLHGQMKAINEMVERFNDAVNQRDTSDGDDLSLSLREKRNTNDEDKDAGYVL
jgi:hypothetical protein